MMCYISTMILVKSKLLHLIIMLVSCWSVSVATDPSIREDVIGNYQLANEVQCQRLCWYRQPCSSYSFSQDTSSAPNCFLHTDSAATVPTNPASTIAPSDKWTEHAASSATIHNACKDRPCDDLTVCVPHDPHSPSFRCLPLPARCGPVPQVAHGRVNVSGTLQGDTAHLTCHRAFAASPRNGSVSTCQVTSKWTPFQATCLQYEFHREGSEYFERALPWPLQDSVLCVTGVYVAEGQMYVNLLPTSISISNLNFDLHFILRHITQLSKKGVFWDTKVNGAFQQIRRLGDLPLALGDSFKLIFRLVPGYLQVTLNTQHVYSIPLRDQGAQHGIDLSRTKVFAVGGPSANITYVNLLTGC